MIVETFSPTGMDLNLSARLQFEVLLNDLSARFVSVTSKTLDTEICDALRRIVEGLGLERSTLARLEGAGESQRFTMTHSANLPGIDPFPGFAVKDLPWMAGVILSGETVCFSSVDDLPKEAVSERLVVQKFGPKSNLTFPLQVGGKIIGALAFGMVTQEREWPEVVVSRLRLFAEMIAGAIARTSAENDIQKAHEEVRHLRDQLQRENVYLRQEVRTVRGYARLIGESAALSQVLRQVGQVAATDSKVLLLGETGTGKELIASAIHEASLRNKRPMLIVSCAAIPETLIESELFGREKGAYTGALSRQVGRFELAHGSTLFLDEIGELSMEVQAKLLRVLQENKVQRLGSSTDIAVDVRIIAATNRNLEVAVREKRFREDLYYRLNVFPIYVPPLRERREDIPILIRSFVSEFAKSFGKPVESIDSASIENLQRYSWPGNIRELRNVVERAVICATGPRLYIDPLTSAPAATRPSLLLSDTEREHVLSVLELAGWRVRGKDGAAEILGLKPTTLDSLLVRLGISPKSQRKDGPRMSN